MHRGANDLHLQPVRPWAQQQQLAGERPVLVSVEDDVQLPSRLALGKTDARGSE
jgi:hypothetical protein